MLKIYYGVSEQKFDVTNICLSKLCNNNIIHIPEGDFSRSKYFSDPLPNIVKKIFVLNQEILTEYDENHSITINTLTNNISSEDFTSIKKEINTKLNNLHSKLKIKYGNFNEELPEQKMAVRYLTGKEKVLEIGGNIGRNSLIIGSIVYNSNFVTLESDINIANQLTENKNLNNLNFFIESSALSNRKLIQKDWDTKPSDILLPGYNWVKTITLKELNEKYKIEFDTLILDCEGAFYYILMDMPEILDNITLIIMENDYYNISEKKYVDEILIKNNFHTIYSEVGGWGPCSNNFFEVWKKDI